MAELERMVETSEGRPAVWKAALRKNRCRKRKERRSGSESTDRVSIREASTFRVFLK